VLDGSTGGEGGAGTFTEATKVGTLLVRLSNGGGSTTGSTTTALLANPCRRKLIRRMMRVMSDFSAMNILFKH
jgi:hypothetical protein